MNGNDKKDTPKEIPTREDPGKNNPVKDPDTEQNPRPMKNL